MTKSSLSELEAELAELEDRAKQQACSAVSTTAKPTAVPLTPREIISQKSPNKSPNDFQICNFERYPIQAKERLAFENANRRDRGDSLEDFVSFRRTMDFFFIGASGADGVAVALGAGLINEYSFFAGD